jgi:8-oxo-dGTP pyrophosphatase MutT (NUDIX family)
MAEESTVRRTFDFQWFKVRWLPRYGWVMDRAPAVVVVPIASDGRVWMERIARPPTKRTSWEFPGGAVGSKESVIVAGLRELEEECGLVARGEVTELSTVLEMAPGMGSFPHHLLLARDVAPKGRRAVPQRSEGVLAVRAFDQHQVRKMVRDGEVFVHATMAALLAVAWLEPWQPVQPRPATPRRSANLRSGRCN